MKKCSKCKIEKEYTAFHKRTASKDGYHYYCKECASSSRKEWITPETRRKYSLKALYGLTPKEYEELFISQGSCCAICFTTEPGGRHNQWHIDHNHDTDKVRGILCNDCNVGLGCFKDDRYRMSEAVVYLRKGEVD